mmetsp:Transcript_3809/g.12619  ORF Transcript_3809/g.12619 Transcript_3809/m.12619 type:complete len:336 (-) Transcript_3809:485-1492(-)
MRGPATQFQSLCWFGLASCLSSSVTYLAITRGGGTGDAPTRGSLDLGDVLERVVALEAEVQVLPSGGLPSSASAALPARLDAPSQREAASVAVAAAAADVGDLAVEEAPGGDEAAHTRAVVGLRPPSPAPPAAWPPRACEAPVTGALSMVCGGGSSSRGGVGEAEFYWSFWEDGSRLLGEEGLVAFLRSCTALEGKIAGKRVKIWGHSEDKIGHKGAFDEQVKDKYGLAKLCQGLRPDDWIADFGGNLGITAIHLKLRCPRCKLVTLEPSPWNYVVLRLNLLQNHLASGGAVALQGGLATAFGEMAGSHYFGNAWASRREDIFAEGAHIKAQPEV